MDRKAGCRRRDLTLWRTYRTSPRSSDAAHNPNFDRGRSHAIVRHGDGHVQAFYAALSTGNGEEAVKLVIPKKRSFGPLSATAISKFYGRLPEPLTLVDVVATRSGEYRVRYRYVAAGPRRCDGESIVRTTQVSGSNLIESIKAVSGC